MPLGNTSNDSIINRISRIFQRLFGLADWQAELAEWEAEQAELEAEWAELAVERAELRAEWEALDSEMSPAEEAAWEVERAAWRVELRAWKAEEVAWEAERIVLKARLSAWEMDLQEELTDRREVRRAAHTARQAAQVARRAAHAARQETQRETLVRKSIDKKAYDFWNEENGKANEALVEAFGKYANLLGSDELRPCLDPISFLFVLRGKVYTLNHTPTFYAESSLALFDNKHPETREKLIPHLQTAVYRETFFKTIISVLSKEVENKEEILEIINKINNNNDFFSSTNREENPNQNTELETGSPLSRG